MPECAHVVWLETAVLDPASFKVSNDRVTSPLAEYRVARALANSKSCPLEMPMRLGGSGEGIRLTLQDSLLFKALKERGMDHIPFLVFDDQLPSFRQRFSGSHFPVANIIERSEGNISSPAPRYPEYAVNMDTLLDALYGQMVAYCHGIGEGRSAAYNIQRYKTQEVVDILAQMAPVAEQLRDWREFQPAAASGAFRDYAYAVEYKRQQEESLAAYQRVPEALSAVAEAVAGGAEYLYIGNIYDMPQTITDCTAFQPAIGSALTPDAAARDVNAFARLLKILPSESLAGMGEIYIGPESRFHELLQGVAARIANNPHGADIAQKFLEQDALDILGPLAGTPMKSVHPPRPKTSWGFPPPTKG